MTYNLGPISAPKDLLQDEILVISQICKNKVNGIKNQEICLKIEIYELPPEVY